MDYLDLISLMEEWEDYLHGRDQGNENDGYQSFEHI